MASEGFAVKPRLRNSMFELVLSSVIKDVSNTSRHGGLHSAGLDFARSIVIDGE